MVVLLCLYLTKTRPGTLKGVYSQNKSKAKQTVKKQARTAITEQKQGKIWRSSKISSLKHGCQDRKH